MLITAIRELLEESVASPIETGDLMERREERKRWWKVDNAAYLDERRSRLIEGREVGKVAVPQIVITPPAVYRPLYAGVENDPGVLLCARRKTIMQLLAIKRQHVCQIMLSRVIDECTASLRPAKEDTSSVMVIGRTEGCDESADAD